MALYKIQDGELRALEVTNFAAENILERSGLQKMLIENIEVIAPNILVIAEEFGDFEGARRRIDILAIDKKANLVVIELKRDEEGGHMELQAIRYAAMVSAMTFDKAVDILQGHLDAIGKSNDAKEILLEFLDWEDVIDDDFCQQVKIILASGNFSKELTASVLWLNERDLDISCIRLKLNKLEDTLLLDVQKIIPLPETAEYQIQLKEKKQKERESKETSRDFTKYDVFVAGKEFNNQSKRWMMFHIISEIIKHGGTPFDIGEEIYWRKNRLFKSFDGLLDTEEIVEKIMETDPGGTVPRTKRYFTGEGESVHFDNKTYLLSNQWGDKTLDAVQNLTKRFPELEIRVKPC